MSSRAQSLAEQFEQANRELMAFITPLSDEEWLRICPDQKRTVAAMAHHLADNYLFEMRYFKGIAEREPLQTVSKEYIDGVNAETGEKYANCDRGEVLKLLDQNGKTASAFVRGLSDEQLQRVGAFGDVDWIPEMSVDQWIEKVLVGHIRGHLPSMQAVAGQRSAAATD